MVVTNTIRGFTVACDRAACSVRASVATDEAANARVAAVSIGWSSSDTDGDLCERHTLEANDALRGDGTVVAYQVGGPKPEPAGVAA